MKKTDAIAVFGTGSDVGKSIVNAALCRSLADRGVGVAPFKSQNMSNNSGITPEGLEMGRAQIVQAQAARIVPHVDMNPVLLKPTGEMGCQVVLNGRAFANATALDYHRKKELYFKESCLAYDRLKSRYDLVVMEGAGSCAEVNLMPSDIVNFPMAAHAKAPVILVADIHRGGVFGQIVGTLACLPDAFRDMVKGFIINRFRGDITLFRDGIEWIEKQTGKPVFGVLPWYSHFRIDAEDSVEIECCPSITALDRKKPAIGVIRLPHISNFTDFHTLASIDGIELAFVDRPGDLSVFKAVIIPGSKNTRADMDWLRSSCWEESIQTHVKNQGCLLGICGGYQMLGTAIEDPQGLEGDPGTTRGLGLLPVKTILQAPKTTTLSAFEWDTIPGEGYEIHMGETQRTAGSAFFTLISRNQQPCTDFDGCIADNGQVAGTYMHGLFDTPLILKKWLNMAGIKDIDLSNVPSKEQNYAQLKDHFERYVNLGQLLDATGVRAGRQISA
ncbi:CobQ [Desulforapulum autotrophicum HRM2]|uniref:Cobyric acid synthase n=1 Tax=Desulforapulum autotrophicum (strain ATCC 43914 / DSM 3382 / VKM B-1955 / HRM2) TaxID=177437 RepID=C0QFF0_DESAH|nr:cobyric acid synthase [Desulforapulum autotrophicum]ACN13346.1 CobQ [Desulforapulum autotrophicum HRM2]